MPGQFSPQPPPQNETVAQYFKLKGLWAWFDSQITNSYNGTSEKGEDFASTFGTPVCVPVGGKILRAIYNNNSIGWVVELQDKSGAVWLYQHITKSVNVGDTLLAGDQIGTENGLPVDQYSTGPHIEVRWCAPGTWKSSTISWLEPWVNPYTIFSTIGQQIVGQTGTGGTLGGGGGGVFGFTGQLPTSLMALAPNADVTVILWAIDQALLITNPLNVTNVPDVMVPIPVIGGSFDTGVANPITWASDVLTNAFNNFSAFVIRAMFVAIGAVIIMKVLGNFIDFSAVGQAAGQIGSLAALAVA